MEGVEGVAWGIVLFTLLHFYKGPVLSGPKIKIITYTLDNPTLLVYNTTMKPIKTKYAIKLAILVTALLVTIKITGVVAWSWWIVLSPLLFLAVLLMAELALVATIVLSAYAYIYFEDRKPR